MPYKRKFVEAPLRQKQYGRTRPSSSAHAHRRGVNMEARIDVLMERTGVGGSARSPNDVEKGASQMTPDAADINTQQEGRPA